MLYVENDILFQSLICIVFRDWCGMKTIRIDHEKLPLNFVKIVILVNN